MTKPRFTPYSHKAGDTPETWQSRLIATAPEMYVALQKTATFLKHEPNRAHDGWMAEVYRDVCAILDKINNP